VAVVAALLAGAAALVLHAATWAAAAGVVAKSVYPPPLQSALALGGSALLLRAVNVSSHRRRMVWMGAILAVFGIAMVAVPLDLQFAGNGFMGDGVDYAQSRDKFERNIPVAGGHPEIQFKSHLGDLFLAGIDRMFGRTEESPAIAYRTLSRVGGLLFIGELLLVVIVLRGSRRACRYVGLALAIPLVIGFFGYYEVGYMSASAAAFPLLLQSMRRRTQGHALEIGGGLQGLHAAFHGFGLLGIAGGVLAGLRDRERQIWTACRFGAFALAAYLVWLLVYVVGFGLSVMSDPYSGHIAFRHLTTSAYFDRRLVHQLLSWRAVTEIGMVSLAVGVPLLVFALMRATSRFERHAALLYALPGLLFLVVWWPSAGVGHDMDLLLGAFAGVSAAIWLASRTPRTAFQAWIVLAVVHVMFWAVVADRTMERIWIAQ
jgi:hypothetical protein